MTNPGAYPPGQAGQGNQSAVIAATPGDQLAEALAAELRNLGWRAVVAEQVATYGREAGVLVAPLTPTSLNSPAISAALATPVAPLIPLIVGSTPLPPGPWATQPVVFSGNPAQTARDIVAAASSLGGAPSTYPGAYPFATGPAPASGYGAPATGGYGMPNPSSQAFPPTGATIPFTPAAPSQPMQPYQAGPSYPTQAGYTQYPQGGAPYTPQAAPAKKRRWPMIVGVIVAVVLLLCVASGVFAYIGLNKAAGAVSTSVSQTATALASDSATATPEATATPTIPANFTVYTDSTAGFSIAYPKSWQKSASGGDVIFLDAINGADMVIGSVGENISQSDIATTEDQFFKSASGGGTYSNVQGPTTVTYAGESWTEKSADIKSSGQTIHAVVLMANHGSRTYIIGYLGLKSSFATLDAQDFQPMLNSLSFQS